MLKAMLHDAMSLMNVMNNLHVSHSGIKYIFICHCFPIGLNNFFKLPNGNHRQPDKSMISNLNNFFSRQFKKDLNGQKFGNLFIFRLLKLVKIR